MSATDAASDLEERVRLLEDERAILATLYRYGHTIDYGLDEEWLDCFTADGAFDVRREAPSGARHEGRAALTAFIEAHTSAPAHYHKHLLVEPRIEVRGDEARVASYLVRLDRNEEGEPYVRSFGRYLDTLVRCDDGMWRFRERIAEVETRRPPGI